MAIASHSLRSPSGALPSTRPPRVRRFYHEEGKGRTEWRSVVIGNAEAVRRAEDEPQAKDERLREAPACPERGDEAFDSPGKANVICPPHDGVKFGLKNAGLTRRWAR